MSNKFKMWILGELKKHCLISLVIALLFGSFCGCQHTEHNQSKFDSAIAYKTVEKLVSFGHRPSGSAANHRQANYIFKQASQYGAQCTTQVFTRNSPLGKLCFTNIEAIIPGQTEQFLLIGCHFDTKRGLSPQFQGANDGASGVAVLLELIRVLCKQQQRSSYSLRFVFFDGEECIVQYNKNDGLVGRKFYAKHLLQNQLAQQCVGVIILDMVGGKNLSITLPSSTSRIMRHNLRLAAKQLNLEKYFSDYSGDILDDHYPFKALGLPVIDLIDFNFGPNNAFWHTGMDNLDQINPKSLEIIGRVTLNMILYGKY